MAVVQESFASTDLTEAEAALRRVYPVVTFRETATPFSLAQRLHGDESAVLARFAIASWADVEVDFGATVAIGSVMSGRYAATSNGDVVDVAEPFVFRPGIGRSQSEGLDIVMVNLDAAALATYAGDMAGFERAGLRTEGTGPVSAETAVTWRRTLDFARRTLETPELLHNDLLRRSTISMLSATALACFPIQVSGAPVRGDGGPVPAAVRRALAYIDEHLADPIGLADIAAAARLSVRGLQYAFRRQLGTTPTHELRRARLAAVREQLSKGDATTTDVSSAARAWGFQHLGRFSGEYRAAYGELPSQTLAR